MPIGLQTMSSIGRSRLDPLSPDERSALMARIRGKDTQPELRVRRILHALGYRFRLHRTDLPGSPDIVFPSRMKVVFVHGCFWHRHRCRKGRALPTRNRKYWEQKFLANCRRDQRARRDLWRVGWRVLTVWECKTTDLETIEAQLIRFLESRS